MVKTKTYFEVLHWASSFLEESGKEKYIAEYLLLERLNWSKTDLLVHFKEVMPQEILQQFEIDLNEVIANKPPQYIIGSTEFLGERFSVTPATLIPRPETEELVMACLEDCGTEVSNVIDIGTGSGIIAISLKLARPNWQVNAVDISEEALVVAALNARKLDATVDFKNSDVLQAFDPTPQFDVIVSNPPYIAESERDVMDESVKQYEPLSALFADDNGLAIYKRIALEAKDRLKPNGKIFLEIGYQQGASVSAIFSEVFPDKNVSVIKDLNQNDRIVKVI